MAAEGVEADDNNDETESSQVPASVSASSMAPDLGVCYVKVQGSKYLLYW